MSGTRATGAAGGTVSLQQRRACAACGASDLDPLLEIPGVPVHMGCIDQPPEADAFFDQRWATCPRCGSVQLAALAPLDLVYPTQHNGAVGGVWARHHTALADFVAARAPRKVVEVGGASGALAREYAALHDVDSWTVVEPNPTFTPEPPINLIAAYVEEVDGVVGEADAVVHSHLLEHLYEPRAFLAGMREQARPRRADAAVDPRPRVAAGPVRRQRAELRAHLLLRHRVVAVDAPGRRVHGGRACSASSTTASSSRPGRTPSRAPRGRHPMPATAPAPSLRFVETARADAQELIARAATFDGPVYLFGAHVFSQFLVGCGFPAERATAVLDNDPAKQGLRLYGTPLTVQPPAVIAERPRPGVAVIVRATHYTAEITEQLRTLAPDVEIW